MIVATRLILCLPNSLGTPSSSLYAPSNLTALVPAYPALNPPEIGYFFFSPSDVYVYTDRSVSSLLWLWDVCHMTPPPSLPVRLPLVSQLKPSHMNTILFGEQTSQSSFHSNQYSFLRIHNRLSLLSMTPHISCQDPSGMCDSTPPHSQTVPT